MREIEKEKKKSQKLLEQQRPSLHHRWLLPFFPILLHFSGSDLLDEEIDDEFEGGAERFSIGHVQIRHVNEETP